MTRCLITAASGRQKQNKRDCVSPIKMRLAELDRFKESDETKANLYDYYFRSRGLSPALVRIAAPVWQGAKIADPSRPVVAFTGDAGLLMVIGELSTLAELRIPVTVLVFVDASLSLIEMKQRGRQMGNRGVDFGQHDFAAIAQAFGGVGVTVSDHSSLEQACREAVARKDGFTLIAAKIDRRAYDGRI